MRVRHIAHAKEDLTKNEKVIQHPVQLKGKWRTILPYETLHIEIGCGKGGYSCQMAQQYQDKAFVAIEKNTSIAYLASKKIAEIKSNNLFLVNFDASNIQEIFDKNEVDVIHLNFSDPWPKKRTHKRRLSHASFLMQYEEILKPEGVIVMKTDNYPLFIYSLNSFVENGWEVISVDTDFRSSLQEDPITEYEQKFMNKNVKINRLIVRRKKDE